MLNVEILSPIEDEEAYPPVAQLIELGRQKGYVTLDDVLKIFPDAEDDVGRLEEAFASLASVGVPYVEDDGTGDPSDDELSDEEDELEDETPNKKYLAENYLANIDTDDMIGLYLKEVGQVPLLTAPEEVELAQRIERGRLAREELAREIPPIAGGTNCACLSKMVGGRVST